MRRTTGPCCLDGRTGEWITHAERDLRLCRMVEEEEAASAEAAARFGITGQRAGQILAKRGVETARRRRRRRQEAEIAGKLPEVVRTLARCTGEEAARALGMGPMRLRRLVPDLAQVLAAERWRRRSLRIRPMWQAREDGAGWSAVARLGGVASAGIARGKVERWARDAGLPMRTVGPRRSRARKLRAVALRAQGMGWAEVARRCGYGSAESAKTSARKAMEEAGEARPQGAPEDGARPGP